MLKKNIYLSGPMGSGKTTVGLILAKKLNLPFVDTDQQIENKLGKSIRSLFARKNGEAFFRKQETQTLFDLANHAPQVVSLGGGAVLSDINRALLRQGIWIHLEAYPAILVSRIKNCRARPLRNSLETLLQKRRPYYKLAPHSIDTTHLKPMAVVQAILKICGN